MKKLILSLLLLSSSLYPEYHIDVYSNLNKTIYTNDGDAVFLQLMFICAVLSAKYTNYKFRTIRDSKSVSFRAYNSDCLFVLTLNNKDHVCHLYFSAYNDSFDYDRFKSIIDSLF